MFDKLFTYRALHEACADSFGFSQITLIADIGPLKKGTQFDSAWYQVETAELAFWKDANSEYPTHTFKAYLGVET